MNSLVVGGDSVIGNGLYHWIARNEYEDHCLVTTTRRKTSAQGVGGIKFLDLLRPECFAISKDQFHLAFMCAGVKGFSSKGFGFAQKDDDDKSWRVNVDGVVNIAMRLICAGTFIVYPSPQAVEWSGLSYVRQHAQVESILLSTWRAAIVRVGVEITERNNLSSAKALYEIGLMFQAGVFRWP